MPEDAVRQSMDELRAAALTTIKDPARAKEVAGLVDELERNFAEALKLDRNHLDRLWALDADYDATQADFRKLFADFNADAVRRRDGFVELRNRLIAATTETEWNELAKTRVRVLESMVQPR
ncbi:MAG TPA: hypothetical protein VE008_00020 [Burkholderiales bacterium]|nr:hypothetical protein [Burkholderiales bacterium]